MFRFTCRPDGGEEFEVVARSRAIAAWENAPGQRKGPKRSLGNLAELGMADYVDMAWYAASRAGKTDLAITQWREEVDVELEKYDQDDEDADPEAGPTQRDR
jgi:hypothetical protein